MLSEEQRELNSVSERQKYAQGVRLPGGLHPIFSLLDRPHPWHTRGADAHVAGEAVPVIAKRSWVACLPAHHNSRSAQK